MWLFYWILAFHYLVVPETCGNYCTVRNVLVLQPPHVRAEKRAASAKKTYIAELTHVLVQYTAKQTSPYTYREYSESLAQFKARRATELFPQLSDA